MKSRLAHSIATVAVAFGLAGTATADPPHKPKHPPSVVVVPQINTLPGVPITPSFYNSPFLPGYNNYNPFLNPYSQNLFVNPVYPFTPTVVPGFNPFLPGLNPVFAVQQPFFNNNPFPFGVLLFSPPVPPIAIQQPGQFFSRGPNLAVNPASGAVYRPMTGVVVQRDGTVYYRVLGTGVPNGFGTAQLGTETFYSPTAGTYFNPQSGIVSRPGTNGFRGWIY